MDAGIDIPAGVRVVMMCGVSGAGKTTVARRFEERGWTRLSPDAIAYGTDMPYPDAVTRALDRLPELLDAGCRVVIDTSMCRRAKRDLVRRVCAECGVGCALIYLSADRDELLRRLGERRGTGPDDRIVPVADLDRFLANFETPGPDEPSLSVPEI